MTLYFPFSTHLRGTFPGRHLRAREFTQSDRQVLGEANCTYAVDSYGKKHRDQGVTGSPRGVMRMEERPGSTPQA